ncbi:glycosyltransferase family 2 protein [Marivirga atlantica]|uniref:Glycosyltransferase family 2 protein n=1 Tax=Marivirga atlantica TaxID=1548457 RepID=A0A937DKP4_9BACT|nr:glycosyltransferase family 2 protein [Marivirga atlantica]MBL0766446.1 glycosyltransferase family 2 protein [Marivirga atlantica]
MDRKKMFFTVIMPVFNKENHLVRSIESVLKQSFADFELLIIDDASKDNSVHIINSFTDPRIKVFKRETPGAGGYAARNLGIEKASTNWICFLDADDEYKYNHLAKLYDAIIDYNAISVFGTSFEIADQKGVRKNRYYLKTKTSQEIDFNEFLINKPFHTNTICIQRDLLMDAGLFPGAEFKRGGDTDTWLRVMHIAQKAFFIRAITSTYYRDSENMVTKTTKLDVSNHPLYFSCKDLLSKYDDLRTRNNLKRHWNNSALPYFKNIAKKRTIKLNELQYFYWYNFKYSKKVVFYFIYSLKHFFSV